MIGAAFGAATFGGRIATQIFRPLLHVTFSDYEIENFMTKKLNVSLSINSKGTCDVVFVQSATSAIPIPGHKIRVEWNESVIFAGLLHEVTTNNERDTNWITCKAVDWSDLFDRHYVAAIFENKTPRQIVEEIIWDHTLLWMDGVSCDEVPDTPTVLSFRGVYKKVSDCLKDLAELIGMDWYCDHNRSIRFFDRATNLAPFSFGDSDQRYSKAKVKRSLESYRNVQWLRAGNAKTDPNDPLVQIIWGKTSSAPDPQRDKTFTLTYEVGEIISIKRSGITQRLGIRNVDDDGDIGDPPTTTWPQFFYELGSNEISQQSGGDETINPTLKANEYLEITYIGLYPLILNAKSDEQVVARRAIEGGSGEYENFETDEDVDGLDFAVEKAEGILSREGYVPEILSFSTLISGLAPGQIWTCTIAKLCLSSASMLIKSVKYSFNRNIMICTVEAITGASTWNWQDFFRRMAAAGRKIEERNQGKLSLFRPSKEIAVFSDVLTDSENDTVILETIDHDPFSWARIGLVVYNGMTNGGCVIGRSRMGYFPE